jgi:5-methylcytosine-specific restriction endonuclease McrA
MTTSWRTAPLPKDWYKIRKIILERDGYRCQEIRHGGHQCPNKATEVDHVIRGANDSLENLRSLCRLCHGRKTQAEGQAQKVKNTTREQEVHPFLKK